MQSHLTSDSANNAKVNRPELTNTIEHRDLAYICAAITADIESGDCNNEDLERANRLRAWFRYCTSAQVVLTANDQVAVRKELLGKPTE